MGIFEYYAGLRLGFQPDVVTEQASAVILQISLLRCLFFARLVGDGLVRPDLTMGMRVAASHKLASVFKNLHVVDVRQSANLRVLFRPLVDHPSNFWDSHSGQSQIMAGGKANYLADAGR